MEKLKHRAVKEVAQAHMASEWQSQDSNPGHLTQGPTLLFFILYEGSADFFLKDQIVNILGFAHQQAQLIY